MFKSIEIAKQFYKIGAKKNISSRNILYFSFYLAVLSTMASTLPATTTKQYLTKYMWISTV